MRARWSVASTVSPWLVCANRGVRLRRPSFACANASDERPQARERFGQVRECVNASDGKACRRERLGRVA